MCKTCNGTGGLNIEHSWGVSFHPCPSTDCGFDRDAAVKKLFATMDRKLREMRVSA